MICIQNVICIPLMITQRVSCMHMSAGNVIVVAITATLAAIGSASIPNSALVSMVTVLQAVGMSQYIPQLSILLAMDWLIGMFRWAPIGTGNLLLTQGWPQSLGHAKPM